MLQLLIFNGIGKPTQLGPNESPNPPGIPEGGDFVFASRPGGAGQAISVTVQGIIEDDCSVANKPYSVTNGVVLRIQ